MGKHFLAQLDREPTQFPTKSPSKEETLLLWHNAMNTHIEKPNQTLHSASFSDNVPLQRMSCSTVSRNQQSLLPSKIHIVFTHYVCLWASFSKPKKFGLVSSLTYLTQSLGSHPPLPTVSIKTFAMFLPSVKLLWTLQILPWFIVKTQNETSHHRILYHSVTWEWLLKSMFFVVCSAKMER